MLPNIQWGGSWKVRPLPLISREYYNSNYIYILRINPIGIALKDKNNEGNIIWVPKKLD